MAHFGLPQPYHFCFVIVTRPEGQYQDTSLELSHPETVSHPGTLSLALRNGMPRPLLRRSPGGATARKLQKNLTFQGVRALVYAEERRALILWIAASVYPEEQKGPTLWAAAFSRDIIAAQQGGFIAAEVTQLPQPGRRNPPKPSAWAAATPAPPPYP